MRELICTIYFGIASFLFTDTYKNPYKRETLLMETTLAYLAVKEAGTHYCTMDAHSETALNFRTVPPYFVVQVILNLISYV